jgi:hypothetical protein
MEVVMDRDRFQRLVDRQGISVDLEEIFNAPIANLFGTSTKVEKGEKQGWLTTILYLSPAKASGFQVCSMATKGCEAACLSTAGRGGIFPKGKSDNAIQAARRRKTQWFFTRRNEFLLQLDKEIGSHKRRAARKGFSPAVRLNGTSDILWETMLIDGMTLFERHPDVVFYDYTKHPARDVSDIPNYSLTFSLAEDNDEQAELALQNGMNVAAVFHTVPETFMGRTVVDGDESDLRFLDPEGVIVGLKAKGKARFDRSSGFVR